MKRFLTVVSPPFLLASVALAQGPVVNKRPEVQGTPKLGIPPKLDISLLGIPQIAPDVRRPTVHGGESQSCILRPGANPASPAGRFFVTNDDKRPPLVGSALGPVFSQSLDSTDNTLLQAAFDAPPNGADYVFGTNDHDLLALNDGSILYVTGAFTKRPLSPKPAWFDVTYRGNFGPGARSNVMVWRSKDAGKTFQYVGEMDPAQVDDGSYAYPQWPRDASGKPVALTTPPGSPQKPVYDMGGSDGQVTRYDARTDTLYLSFGGVGYLPDTTKKTSFTLSYNGLGKTLVLASTNQGETWTKQGDLGGFSWRFGIAPQPSGPPIFAQGYSTLFVPNTSFSKVEQLSTGAAPGWPTFGSNPAITPLSAKDIGLVYVNIWAHQIVGRMPGGRGVFLTYPETITDDKGVASHGYRLFFFDRKRQEFTELDPILPKKHGTDQFAMHLVAIDSGDGPVLLYWMDVNAAKRTATIRGRVLLDESTSYKDVALSQKEGKPYAVDLTARTWYGDYWTAGGFSAASRTLPRDQKSYFFYPMWVEQGGKITYTKVTVVGEPDQPLPSRFLSNIPELTRRVPVWRKPFPPDPTQQRRLRELLEHYERH